MKKLLTLMLVLVLASAANAVVVGSYTLYTAPAAAGPYTPGVDNMVLDGVGSTLWIGVNNSVAGVPGASQMGAFILGIQIPSVYIGDDPETGDPIYEPSGPADTNWTGAFVDFRPPLVAGAPVPANEYLGVGGMGGSLILDSWFLTLTDGQPASFQGIGILDAKQLQCIGPASYDTIYLLDTLDGTVLDTLIIHQTAIPEPMTITLLALGGLLLRRRK